MVRQTHISLLTYWLLAHDTVKLYSIYMRATQQTGLTLSQYGGHSNLELVFGLFHLLLMLILLAHQPANVAVGRLDHGVEVVGVPAVDFTSFQPGQ